MPSTKNHQTHSQLHESERESRRREFNFHLANSNPLPAWDTNQIRRELLKENYLHTTARGHLALGQKSLRTEVRQAALELHRERFEESRLSKIKSAYKAIAKEAHRNPAIMAAVEQLRRALAAAKLDPEK